MISADSLPSKSISGQIDLYLKVLRRSLMVTRRCLIGNHFLIGSAANWAEGFQAMTPLVEKT